METFSEAVTLPISFTMTFGGQPTKHRATTLEKQLFKIAWGTAKSAALGRPLPLFPFEPMIFCNTEWPAETPSALSPELQATMSRARNSLIRLFEKEEHKKRPCRN